MPDIDQSEKRMNECAPIAREIIHLVGEASEEVPLLKADSTDKTVDQLKWYQEFIQSKVLPAISAADLRVADIEFLNSLMIQPVDMVREALQDLATDKVREAILHDMAKKVIHFMGLESGQLPMGDIDKSRIEGLKNFVKEQLHDQLSDVIGKLIDVESVMKLVLAPFSMISNMLVATRSASVDGAVAYRFGLKNSEDIRFSHIVKAQVDKSADTPLSPSAPVQPPAK